MLARMSQRDGMFARGRVNGKGRAKDLSSERHLDMRAVRGVPLVHDTHLPLLVSLEENLRRRGPASR